MNDLLPTPEPFTCWSCQRECFGERVPSGHVVICEPCNRCEPSPLRVAYYDPRALLERVAPCANEATAAELLAPAESGVYAKPPANPAAHCPHDCDGCALLDRIAAETTSATVRAAVADAKAAVGHSSAPASPATVRCVRDHGVLVAGREYVARETSDGWLSVYLDAERDSWASAPVECFEPSAAVDATADAHAPQAATPAEPADARSTVADTPHARDACEVCAASGVPQRAVLLGSAELSHAERGYGVRALWCERCGTWREAASHPECACVELQRAALPLKQWTRAELIAEVERLRGGK